MGEHCSECKDEGSVSYYREEKKKIHPLSSHCYISSVCGVQCTPGVLLQGDLIQLFGGATFSQSASASVGDFPPFPRVALDGPRRAGVCSCVGGESGDNGKSKIAKRVSGRQNLN